MALHGIKIQVKTLAAWFDIDSISQVHGVHPGRQGVWATDTILDRGQYPAEGSSQTGQ